MSDNSVINSSTSDAIDQLVIDSGRMHKVINGSASESVTVEDGSLIPSLRKALLENLYYKTPVLPWTQGSTTQVFNQLYAYTQTATGAVSWWYAPSATATNPVSMGATPTNNANWRVVLDSATISGLYATIESPDFTGLPTAPTVDVDDVSNSLATTKFVNALIAKVLQDVTMIDASIANLSVTGLADIFQLTVQNGAVTERLTVKDLDITGTVTGIQTTVDGIDIAPKSVTTTEKLEVGGDTTLHGTFQLADKTIILGDGTVVDLTNIGSASTIAVSPNLDLVVGNENFVWDPTTLNSPVLGSTGKGISIAKTATSVTQVTWPDGETSPFVRSLEAGVWTAWSNAIASTAVAEAGTAVNLAVSPAGVKAFIAQFGIATDDPQSTVDLNDVLLGQTFTYDVGAANAPTASVAGRGVLLASTPGNATQLVVENTNNKMFIRYNLNGTFGAWTEFEGKQGEQGEPGQRGLPGETGLSAYEVYVKDLPEGETPLTETEWLDSLQGKSFEVNASGPSAERAQYDDEAKGFAFLDTTTGMLYIKDSAATADWSDGIPFKGDKGDPGVNGSTWYSGTTVPAAGTGVNGDYYLKTDTYDVYKKTAGAWAIVTNIKGTPGTPGAPGDDGTDGATWLSGAVAPVAGDGKDGDFYLNTVTLDVYKKAAGAWTVTANLKGEKGDPGEKGEQGNVWTTGPTVPDNSFGNDGDMFLNLTPDVDDGPNGDVYQKISGVWTLVGNIRGPATDGGGDGAKWYNGATPPATSLGADGDYYLQTTILNTAIGNGDVYAKAAGAWTKQGNIKGADGTGSSYVLPAATASTLGGVKIGTGITVTADGTISSSGGGSVTFATTAEAKAATSTTVAMSPARVREYMESHGFTAAFTTTATDLDLVVLGDLFNYSDTTLHTPLAGSYGRGICIPSGGGYATQLAIENDSRLMFARYQANNVWGAWGAIGGGGGGTVEFATTAEAIAGTSTTKASSPARVREQFEPMGLGSTFTLEATNLNTLVKGQMWNWGATTTNVPVAGSYGRGLTIPGGTGYVTQLAIVNDTAAMYVRYQNGASTWSTWTAVGGGGGALPVASATTLGGVKIGAGVTVATDGTISVSGGGGGGTSIPAAVVGTQVPLNKTTASDLGLTGTVLPVVGVVYQIKAVLLTQGTAAEGATFSVKFKEGTQGSSIYRMDVRSPDATGVITSHVADQASVALTGCNGPGQNGVTVIEGIVQFNYVGTTHPDLSLLLLTGNYMNILKGSSITYTPVGTLPL